MPNIGVPKNNKVTFGVLYIRYRGPLVTAQMNLDTALFPPVLNDWETKSPY
jgi:hypothetical protein